MFKKKPTINLVGFFLTKKFLKNKNSYICNMINITTYTLSEYIRSRKDLRAKIKATEQMISALEDKMLESIDDIQNSEYLLDDGQVRVQSRYRSTAEIQQSLEALEKMLQRYINQHNGRIYVLRGRLNY